MGEICLAACASQYCLCTENQVWYEVTCCIHVLMYCRYFMQATKGDNVEDRPMWAEKGGLDFEGRAKWDAWTAVKGTATQTAMLAFVKVLVVPADTHAHAAHLKGIVSYQVLPCMHHRIPGPAMHAWPADTLASVPVGLGGL